MLGLCPLGFLSHHTIWQGLDLAARPDRLYRALAISARPALSFSLSMPGRGLQIAARPYGRQRADSEGSRSRSRSPGLPGREAYFTGGVPLCAVCRRSGALCTRAHRGDLVEVCRTCFGCLEILNLGAQLPAGPELLTITEGLEVLYGLGSPRS